jgi:hypothetical protein
MSFTNTAETLVLSFLFTTGTATRPTEWYLGLFTSAPGEAAGGTELSGDAYARKAIAFTAAGNLATNSGNVEFDAATGDWGTVTHVAVFDAATSGNMIAYAALGTSKAIGTGDIFRIPTGDFDLTLT